MADNYSILIEKLEEFLRKFYKNQLIKGAIFFVSIFLGIFLAVAISEYFGNFGTATRLFLFSFFSLSSLAVLIYYIIIPLLKLNKLTKTLSYEEVAEIVGKHFQSVEDKVLNILQLKQQHNNNQDLSLIEASIYQKINEIKPVPFVKAIDFSANRKYLNFLIPVLILFASISFFKKEMLFLSFDRIVQYDKEFEAEAPFKFSVENESLKIIQGDDFNLKVKVSGNEIPESAFIIINESSIKLKKIDNLHFEYSFKNVQEGFDFVINANGFKTKKYSLEVIAKPIMLGLEIKLNYPAYTGRKNEVISNTGDLNIPIGTKVLWNLTTQNTEEVHFLINDSTQILKGLEKNLFQIGSPLFKSQVYAIKTKNPNTQIADSVQYSINVIPDEYPSIQAEKRVDSTNKKVNYFRGTIGDDYGFKQLLFRYKHISKNGVKDESIPLPVESGRNNQPFYFSFDFANLSLEMGDKVEYYFEVFDNDGINGSKSSKTEVYEMKAPNKDELAANNEQANSEVKNALKNSMQKSKEIQKKIEDMQKRMLEKEKLDWDDKKKMQDLLNELKKLEEQVEKLQQTNKQNQEEQQEFNQTSESLLEKQQQLENLMEKVVTDEMKKKMEELQKMMDKLDKKQLQEKLEDMKMSNKDIEKELDRSLEIFKQLELEKKMEETKEKLKELAEEQKKLSEESAEKKSDSKDLKEKQDKLNEKFENIKKDLKDITEKNEQLEDPNKLSDTKEQQEKASEEQKKASDNLDKNNKKSASESQKKAAEKMEEMAQKMEEDMEQMEEESQGEDMQAMRDLLENLIKLSIDQEKVMQTIKKTNQNDPNYVKLTQEQKKLKDDSKMIEDSLFALSKRVPQLDAIVNREISAINNNMDKAIKLFADRNTPGATAKQQTAMTSINNLALILAESLDQMQKQEQQKQQKKKGQQSCNKPGSSGQPKQSMKQMKEMQQKISQQMQKMKEQMEKEGGQPKGKKPGSSGQSSMSEELVKMAAQQEALRNQLRKLADEIAKDKEGNGMGQKTNLQKIQEQMEKNEEDIINRRINQETIKRQQDILTRLLEAENAERQRELDNERKSNEARKFERTDPKYFEEYNKLKEKESELLKTIPVGLNPYYKNKVNEYFNSIPK